MANKLDQYNTALMELLGEAVRCSPASWEKGELVIDCDGRRIDYKLTNEFSNEKASLSQELAQLSERYWTLFVKHQEPWSQSTIKFWRDGGEWEFNVAFKRPEPTPPEKTIPRSLWKFLQ